MSCPNMSSWIFWPLAVTRWQYSCTNGHDRSSCRGSLVLVVCVCVCVCACVFAAASRWGREGGLGVHLAVWLEVPLEAEEDGHLQEAQVEVPHGATGEDRTSSHLCFRVFSGEREWDADKLNVNNGIWDTLHCQKHMVSSAFHPMWFFLFSHVLPV